MENIPEAGWKADLYICGGVYKHRVVKVLSPTRIIVVQVGNGGDVLGPEEEVTWRKSIRRWITKNKNEHTGGWFSVYR